MKISKLFHWLYALVMLLPIFAIGVTCGYAMFNKNAFKSYKDEEILNVNTLSDFEYQNRYYYRADSSIVGVVAENDSRIYTTDFHYNNQTYNNVSIWFYGTATQNIRVYAKNLDDNTNLIDYGVVTQYQFDFIYLRDTFNSNSFDLVKSYFSYKNVKTIDNVFYYSVDKVTQSNLFNWAYDSFLVAPFTYIVSLFSMPVNSPVVMLLSYWLAISIIWLVFDLIMYVPLLVHRWLDKGVIE